MGHASPLVAILAFGLGLAFVFGTAANRLKLSPIAGYLLAGIVIGPFTPGFVADSNLTLQLAEIGVILLMFGVGLHFSLKDLWSVRATVLPGAVLQVTASAAIGACVARLIGWPWSSGIVFGLSLAIASTIVTIRALQDRRLLESNRGRLAVGWLVVQDVLTVIVLVLLPPLAPLLRKAGIVPDYGGLAVSFEITIAKLAAFAAVMWIIGRRVIPEVLHYVAHTGSRELFRLAVLAIALCVAFAASEIFGISIALGAFFAGMILSESTLSQRAAEESLPLRDAFAVLFFLSIGMLFNPVVLVREPAHLAMALAAVVLGTTAVAFLLMRLFGYPTGNAFFVAASLAQIGEFSFILIGLGIGLKLVPADARDLVLGTSILSILINPALLALATALRRKLEPPAELARDAIEQLVPTTLSGHAVVVGFGRVGSLVADGLRQLGIPFVVIEDAPGAIERLKAEGVEAFQGNAADARLLAAANVSAASRLFVAIPQAFEAGQIVEQARRANPGLDIVARAHFDDEVGHLMQHGANVVIMGEREIAQAMLAHARGRGSENPEGR